MSENQKEVYEKYRPLKGNVLLKPIILDTDNDYLPENLKVSEYYAEIVSVGLGIEEVELGQVIIYPKYGVTAVNINGEELLVIKETDILLITEHKVVLFEPESNEFSENQKQNK